MKNINKILILLCLLVIILIVMIVLLKSHPGIKENLIPDESEYDIDIVNQLHGNESFDASILAVAHNEFSNVDIKSLMKENSVIYDVKGFLDRNIVDVRL